MKTRTEKAGKLKKDMQRYELITIFDISGKREDLGFCYGGWFPHHRRHKHSVVRLYGPAPLRKKAAQTNKQTNKRKHIAMSLASTR